MTSMSVASVHLLLRLHSSLALIDVSKSSKNLPTTPATFISMEGSAGFEASDVAPAFEASEVCPAFYALGFPAALSAFFLT